jgi:nitroimidazol reductase NimA-like FMN-containing flavoprotein (pyridoxamine 5'-phosphate oxidase superfamily)
MLGVGRKPPMGHEAAAWRCPACGATLDGRRPAMNSHAEPVQQPETDDLARRIGQRRVQLGMSENALAVQSGMAPRYLQQLFSQGPGFDPGGFMRIASVLGLSYQEMLEGRADPPPGQGAAASHPVLMHLTANECWDKLGTHGVGHIALPGDPAPVVLPVNYVVDGHAVLYRTETHGPAAPAGGTEVSFQADRIDDRRSEGWSVLLSGVAERIEDPEAARRLTEQHPAEPWAGGDRRLWVRVEAAEVTGRRITGM